MVTHRARAESTKESAGVQIASTHALGIGGAFEQQLPSGDPADAEQGGEGGGHGFKGVSAGGERGGVEGSGSHRN